MSYKFVFIFLNIILVAVLIAFFVERLNSRVTPLGWKLSFRWNCSVFDPSLNQTRIIKGCWYSAPYPNCRIVGFCYSG